jgi:hypothetical protein
MHGVSNVFMDKLLSLLHLELLLKGNKMLATTYAAMKLVKALGLNYEPIHACTNGCVLFCGALKQSHVCPQCDANRYVVLTNRTSIQVQT